MRELVIDGVRIADNTDCYVIAEIGNNHQGNIDICKQMFDAAKWAGCNAVKLQKRDNKTLYSEAYYNAPYNSENAYGATYGLHREALEFDLCQYAYLQAYAKRIGITFFATAFDIASADILAHLDVPAIKIASGDLTNDELLRHVMWLGIPMIVSTGGGSEKDISNTFKLSRPNALLHCTSGYPAKYEELNLRCIPMMRADFPEIVVGWSAHDTGIAMAPVAYALGARIIEKHFTLNRAWKGTDQSFSLEPQGMKAMIDNLKQCKLALGDGFKRPYLSEIEALKKQRKTPTVKLMVAKVAQFPDPEDLGPRQWGTEELLFGVAGKFTFKRITMKEGSKGGLQYHHKKDEGGYVVSGLLRVRYDDGTGNLAIRDCGPGSSFFFSQGAVHQGEALTEVVYIEASTPYLNDRVHVEDQYGIEGEEGGLPSTKIEDVISV